VGFQIWPETMVPLLKINFIFISETLKLFHAITQKKWPHSL
jgi:hypothetical protein